MRAEFFASVGLLTILVLACNGGASLNYVATEDPNARILDPKDNPDNGPDTTMCDFGYSYEGFGGTRLEAGRADEDVGFDRDRVKPYTALSGELQRVLNAPAPVLLAQLSSTFGQVPPRWYVEPQANAVSLYSALRVAFVGCIDLTNTTDFDAMPSAANAPDQCTAFAHQFWNRAPDTDEVQACVDVVTQGTAQETQARRKWAYACASVLSSAPFLTF
jgi:hypothetical protein